MKSLLEYLKTRHCQGFKPVPHISEDGNFIEWYWSDRPCYSEAVHNDGKWVGTIYNDMETKEVVGVTIHLEAIK